MTKYFWSIPGLTIYLYAMSIWTQYGFYSYFGVPYNLINASLVTNVVYYFQLFQAGLQVLGAMSIFSALILGTGIVGIIALWYIGTKSKKAVVIVATFGMLILLWLSASFGTWLAQNSPQFYTAESGCVTGDASPTNIVVGFDGIDAIFVPVATSTHKMLGGFVVRDISQLPCTLAIEYTGALTN